MASDDKTMIIYFAYSVYKFHFPRDTQHSLKKNNFDRVIGEKLRPFSRMNEWMNEWMNECVYLSLKHGFYNEIQLNIAQLCYVYWHLTGLFGLYTKCKFFC